MSKERKRLLIGCSTIILVFTGLCIALILVPTDFYQAPIDYHKIPDDLSVSSRVNRDDVEVTGIIWYEVRQKGHSKPHMSFEVLIENKGEEILEIRYVWLTIRDEDGEEKTRGPVGYGWSYMPYLVLYPGESRPFWAISKPLPERDQSLDWAEAEIRIELQPVREFLECRIYHVYDIEINEIGFDEEGMYVIDGEVGEALRSDDLLLPAAYFSFYDENGNFIGGRGIEYSEGSTHLYDRWDPYEEPIWRNPLFFYESGFFQGEVASYKFHFVETDSEYYYCP
jgi:hypothetical protein